MSDVSESSNDPSGNDPSGGAPEGSGSAPTGDARLLIHNQYLKDLSFESPAGPARLADLQGGPELKVDIRVNTEHQEARRHEVTLSIDAKAMVGERAVFIAELQFAGLVSIGESVEDTHIDPVLRIEAPRFLFPFARQILADVTRHGGFPPLLINPIDFAQMYLKERMAAGETAAP